MTVRQVAQQVAAHFVIWRDNLMRALLLLSTCFLLASAGRGQSVRATILGTVTDSSGAVIRGAKVTAVQNSTG
jgi:hypothetical protein